MRVQKEFYRDFPRSSPYRNDLNMRKSDEGSANYCKLYIVRFFSHLTLATISADAKPRFMVAGSVIMMNVLSLCVLTCTEVIIRRKIHQSCRLGRKACKKQHNSDQGLLPALSKEAKQILACANNNESLQDGLQLCCI